MKLITCDVTQSAETFIEDGRNFARKRKTQKVLSQFFALFLRFGCQLKDSRSRKPL